MPIQPNIKRFQESITHELNLIKDRVRDLIGNANWGADGSYKEAVLRRTISQFLPSNLNIGTGFIVGNNDHLLGSQGLISTQLDIIIYEGKSPVVFKEGDFVIVTESSVRAVIEVKTKVANYGQTDKNALNNILAKLNRLRVFPSLSAQTPKKKFIGVFSYEYDGDFESDVLANALRISDGMVNHISLGPDKFIRYWHDVAGLNPPLPLPGRYYIRYGIDHLSFSYFISNLLHIVSDEDPHQRYWFSFPIEGTKEQLRQGSEVLLP